MTAAQALLGLGWLGLTMYALLGGADFGGGFWDAVAGEGPRGLARRGLIDHAIGPVWEANHVWLIFVLVLFWTCFPLVFASVLSTMYVPLTLVALGVIARGSAFAFRKAATELWQARLFGGAFAVSSVLTPFFLGTVAGGIASGRVPADGYGDRWTSWVNPTSLFGGVLAIGTCALLAGVFLCADAARTGHGTLADTLRRRTLAIGLLTGIVVFAALVPLQHDAPTLAHGLERQAAPLIVASGIAGVLTLLLVWRRRFGVARLTAVAAVATVVSGWGVGQYPWLLVDQVRINDAGGASSTLAALLVAVACAGVLVLPPLAALYWFTQTGRLGADHG
jgi:cytochrome bd ubiquinol oxidase subunit II